MRTHTQKDLMMIELLMSVAPNCFRLSGLRREVALALFCIRIAGLMEEEEDDDDDVGCMLFEERSDIGVLDFYLHYFLSLKSLASKSCLKN